jgi:hypothetical protein
MTLIQIIIFLVGFAIAAYLAYWVITKFFPAPAQMPILAIVGVLLLLALIYAFFPDAGNMRVWR